MTIRRVSYPSQCRHQVTGKKVSCSLVGTSVITTVKQEMLVTIKFGGFEISQFGRDLIWWLILAIFINSPISSSESSLIIYYFTALIAYWMNTVFWDWVLWLELDHRACDLMTWSIRPKNEFPKHCTSSITELYTSIKLSTSLNNIRFMCVFFIPKIDRHSVHLHARVVILKLHPDICVTSQINAWHQQSCNKRFIRNDCIPWWSMTIL